MSVPTGTEQKLEPVYLGGAVYASFDGYHIWLHLNAHYSPGLIALEPKVYEALKRYAKKAWGKS